jgi:hypothetical protein
MSDPKAEAARLSFRSRTFRSQLLQPGVGVEKVQFPPKQPKLVGYKMSRKLRKSFVELPNAKFFSAIFW